MTPRRRRAFARIQPAPLAILAAALSISALSAQAPSTLSVTDALARATEASPAAVAARTARPIDVGGIAVARQRPNPDFGFEYDKETPHWAFVGTLPIEISGKRQRRIDVANATLAVTDAEMARIIADLRAEVRRAYFTAVAANRRITIAQELEALATRARDAAQERFQTGAAPRLEALQAGLVLAQAQNEVAVARGEATAARAELNALLAYPADAAPSLADALETGPPLALDAVTQQTIASNAELNVLQKRIDEARARAGLARALRHPDPSVMGALTYDAPGEFTTGWRLGANIALPVFTTGKADVAVADATVARAEADRSARLAEITGAVAAALARATAARQALDRYTGELLPALQEIEQMADESYRAGQTGLPAYLQTVQAAREMRTRALQAGLDYQRALADLERAMGTPLK
jgi:cobalt-zinc-cadmium efflux system outer membrane protein